MVIKGCMGRFVGMTSAAYFLALWHCIFFGIQFQITAESAYEGFFFFLNLETAASVPASAVTPLYNLCFNWNL